MGKIDGNAARAARAEAENEPKTYDIADATFTLPNELPFRVASAWEAGDNLKGLEFLFGEDQWAALLALDPTVQDMEALALGVAREYGFGSPGESPASGASSRKTGKRSRRTSAGTTGSG